MRNIKGVAAGSGALYALGKFGPARQTVGQFQDMDDDIPFQPWTKAGRTPDLSA